MIPTVKLEEALGEIDRPWSPVEVARVNDQVLRMALFLGEYHWHKHTGEDELFFVYRGRIVIRIRGHEDVTLSAGELAVVPRGVEHSPVSQGASYVIMFEPLALRSAGDPEEGY